MALIDDQWWPLGSRPRGALLTAVNARGAWLRHADGRIEHLGLHAADPGPSVPAPDAGASPRPTPATPTPPPQPRPFIRPPSVTP